MEHADVIVVGAGIAGLTAAAISAKRGRNVIVFESAGELGGCASKFDRGSYRFAAGATVGMGFEVGGVFRNLYEELEMPLPKLQDLSIIMDVHLPDGKLRYWKHKEQWYQQLEHQFPQHSQRMIAFYEEVFWVTHLMQGFIKANPIFPPRRITDMMQLLKLVNPGLMRLVPFLADTVYDRLKHYGIHEHREFMSFLNGQLIDSVQTTADRSPVLLGYMALSVFHQGAFYVYGGLAKIAEQLAQCVELHGGKILMRHAVTQFRAKAQGWQVETAKHQVYTSDHLVLANSMHNLTSIADAEVIKQLPHRIQVESRKPSWGAFTMYMGAQDTFIPERTTTQPSPLFHQFIQSYDSPLTDGNQFLFSISAADDDSRAASGHRAITVSTHTDAKQWWNREAYDARKEKYATRITDAVEQRFPGFKQAIDIQLTGTPVTFHRYTKRHFGQVGGYIPTGASSLFQQYSIRTGVESLWACGDTVFPGAGTLGTAMSGWQVAREITKL
jgi:C-3',4' desaturase CrtD